jgi:hypothetical protein
MPQIDAASAARIVASLDAELAKRQSKRDAAEDRRWADEGLDDVILLARRLARHWDRHRAKPKTRPLAAVPEDLEFALEEALEQAKSLYALAEAVERAERLREIEASGAPRRRPVVIGPRVRAAAPSAKAKPTVDILAKCDGPTSAPRKSRTEIWREQQQAQAAARQGMLPRPETRPAPPETALGWFRGVVDRFDQQAKSGVVKFVGMAGITESAFGPDVALRSGHANFFPGEKVDCRLVKRVDGSVVIEAVKMASGADPRGSVAKEAAAEEARRFQIQIDRKWLN